MRGLVLPDDPGLCPGAGRPGSNASPAISPIPCRGGGRARRGRSRRASRRRHALRPRRGESHSSWKSNIRGTYELAHAAALAGVSRLVFASSDEVYPSLYAKYLPIDETHPREPYSFYGLTKVAGEELLHYYRRAHDLPAAIARFSLVYEPWEAVSPKGTLAASSSTRS